MEWQPIETAPQDGTRVLLYGQFAGEISAEVEGTGIYIGWYAFSNGGGTDYPGYDWYVVGGDAYMTWCKPTYWMPLPNPPA